ncbi:MAG TPA: hypothetical protein VMT95_05040 [Candidatus Binatia bacterium]|nr:hypothetical protein [Candidatus Binatia bacterium]
MRFIGLALSVVLLASAFLIGRVTAPTAASASMMQPMVTTFSHFECYTAKFGQSPSAAVQLTDQFQTYQTKIGAPELFCTPVAKKVLSGPHFRTPSPADHLTCYAIQGPTINAARPYANQFLKQDQVTVGSPTLLCVPTHKTG